MADNSVTEQDFEAHSRTYSGFVQLFKVGTILSLIAAAIVVALLVS